VAAIRGLPMRLMDKVILEFSTPDVFPKQDGAMVEDAWLLYGGDLDRRAGRRSSKAVEARYSSRIIVRSSIEIPSLRQYRCLPL
jgi:hypothetical protein